MGHGEIHSRGFARRLVERRATGDGPTYPHDVRSRGKRVSAPRVIRRSQSRETAADIFPRITRINADKARFSHPDSVYSVPWAPPLHESRETESGVSKNGGNHSRPPVLCRLPSVAALCTVDCPPSPVRRLSSVVRRLSSVVCPPPSVPAASRGGAEARRCDEVKPICNM